MTRCYSIPCNPSKPLLTYLRKNITLLLAASYSRQRLTAVVTHILLHYPQRWYSIYPLSIFRLGNWDGHHVKRCLHEIHCKSKCNLWPTHAPVITIKPVSFTITCQAHYPPPKIQIMSVYRWTHRQTHLLHKVNFDRRLPVGLHHRSKRFLNCNLSTTTSIFPSLLDTAVSFFKMRFTQYFFKWQVSAKIILPG